MKKIKIVGVPEHFNLPWHMAIEEGAFSDRGIDLQWTDIPEGTGRMCQLLKENETDIAIILTEGIIKDIIGGNNSKIVQTYVHSPLTWGIHVAANSSYQTLDDIEGTKAAISRYGSGSHLMAYVNAKDQGWDLEELQFEIVNNIDGAVKALTDGSGDYFLWERFTTKPLVDQGIFRKIGDRPTPWPCFVIAVTDDFLKEHSNYMRHILEVINLYTEEFKTIPSIDRTLANRYGQQIEDIQEWLGMTQWGQEVIEETTIVKIQEQLKILNIIPKTVAYSDLVHPLD